MDKLVAKKYNLVLKGISEKTLKEHYKLYEGYINKTNEIWDKLLTADRTKANATYSEYRELKLEESYSLDGVKLHELYFENLGGPGGMPDGLISQMIAASFGSFEAWKEDFIACGISSRGWTVLCFDPIDLKLHNYLQDLHNHGIIARTAPLLVMDTYEHAYFIDYGTDKKGYIKAFMDNIKWSEVNKRVSLWVDMHNL
ncbi:superoxide dismutase, Fe-Mn family [Caldanaerobius fijiensis DSM 17918]|uniref:superoxide dismutase n=1 Tax=Caldanaerobius fijiensis DSM 17918 TaxID=1121256 RepID=A0A1M4V3S0_9THEO|nr:Fe-Mn family superoxide dismutase [Caldanaerobius fijiensis]SHE63634.1 superoxide dismutase, Fe-Mn family [Caldanaerobius fijiensis DSM 17918]